MMANIPHLIDGETETYSMREEGKMFVLGQRSLQEETANMENLDFENHYHLLDNLPFPLGL